MLHIASEQKTFAVIYLWFFYPFPSSFLLSFGSYETSVEVVETNYRGQFRWCQIRGSACQNTRDSGPKPPSNPSPCSSIPFRRESMLRVEEIKSHLGSESSRSSEINLPLESGESEERIAVLGFQMFSSLFDPGSSPRKSLDLFASENIFFRDRNWIHRFESCPLISHIELAGCLFGSLHSEMIVEATLPVSFNHVATKLLCGITIIGSKAGI